MKSIILLGAPGSGKGTLAEQIKANYAYEHVSTGDLLRAAMKAGSELGKQAKGFIEAGQLVPDELIVNLIREVVTETGLDKAYMFDGFPRTIAQAEQLDSMIIEFNGTLDNVFLLEIEDEVIVSRLCSRRTCKECGAIYNLLFKKPAVEGVCDQCGKAALYQRDDDKEETILNRLSVFKNQTLPLIEYYGTQGKVTSVCVNRGPVEIFESVKHQLGE